MKKNRILSSLLCLSLAAGLLIPGLPAYAEGEGESGSSSGMKLSKTAVANNDGTYTITLEAYATGQKVISQVDKDVPTDIVLVLDQSGSMSQNMNTYDFREYTNKRNRDYYDLRHNNNRNNGNLYYKLEDGSYATVSVTIVTYKYTECPDSWPNEAWNGNSNYYANRYNLYVKVGEEDYQQVILTRDRDYFWEDYTYTYTFPDKSTFEITGDDNSPGNFDGRGPLYVRSTTQGDYIYTYTYTDSDNVTHTIGTSTGANTVPKEFTLYERYSTGTVTRLSALKTAVTTFADSVATKAAGADGKLGTDDDINHRVAVVGFASESGYGNNTELLSIAGSNSGSVGVAYGSISDQNLIDVLQDMSTTDGKSMVTKAINALAAEGATEVDLGMDMAQRILKKNPVPAGEKRNRVVVVFTDGSPTTFNEFEMDVATDAIDKANTIKTDGAKVYAVGIFNGADPTTAGNSDGNNTEKSNWFMQNLSSNNGTVSIPGCYLSASDSTTLNSIFEKLADNIESGGSFTTLDSSAVIKDIISPQFTLPKGATVNDITLETYQCIGKDGDKYTWSKNAGAMGAEATVNGDQVNVTGFNFSENWCGTENNNGTTTYRGNKLVISFKAVTKAGFLGGNNVYTNTSAGVYENANAQTPVLTFDRPQVNVPIKDVTVTPEEKNVYLLNGVTLDELKTGATVKVGNVSLDLSKANDAEKPYGLEKWQTEYVDITVEITDKDGKVISADLEDLTEDKEYTVTVTVKPKTNGTGASGDPNPMIGKSGNGTANINVYKPELTYQDSEVFYGDDVPTDAELAANLTGPVWKHVNDVADNTTMGAAPDLAITYTPEADKTTGNKINSKDDIQVKATVTIKNTDVTGNTTFVHTPCDPACGWNETGTPNGNPAFLLHVKTATLTITKAGNVGATEGFIFNVTGPQNFKVSVQGNGSVTITGLPLGTYTVTEDTDWSWRYKDGVSISVDSVTLTDSVYTAEVTVTNTKKNNYLLDGNAYAQNNSVRPAAGN